MLASTLPCLPLLRALAFFSLPSQLVFGIIFSMVGGMMVFIVCHELLPAAHRYMGNSAKATAWLLTGMFIMALSLVLFQDWDAPSKSDECVDEGTTGLINGATQAAYSCAELAGSCQDATHGGSIRDACPLTCAVCTP